MGADMGRTPQKFSCVCMTGSVEFLRMSEHVKEDAVEFIADKIKSRSRLTNFFAVLSITLATVGIIFWGVEPYISVTGSMVTFELPAFQNCDIGLVSTRFVQSYSMVGLDQSMPLLGVPPSPPIMLNTLRKKDFNRNLGDVQVENLYS